jgi:polyvinyl alcohol dehydrogenase (cytochrome)
MIRIGQCVGALVALAILAPAISTQERAARDIAAQGQAAPDGGALFKEHCAMCHGAAQGSSPAMPQIVPGRAPTPAVLAEKTQQEILQTLESGAMVVYGNQLNEAQRRAIAAFLSSKVAADVSSANLCASAKPITREGLMSPQNWNGWGVDVLNTRYQTHASIGPENVAGLKVKWAFGIPNASSALGQPTVVAGRVFIGSGDGTVYALDATTGCTLWTYKAETTVRAAITVGPDAKGGALAYVGDSEANVYALDAAKGTLIWKAKVDPHPTARITGAPQLYDSRLYVPLAGNEELTGGDPSYPCCTFRGGVVAMDALTGKQIWKAYAIAAAPSPTTDANGHTKYSPAGAGIWDSPTIDAKRGALYVGTGDAYIEPADEATDAIVAFDLTTGKRLWVQQKTSGDVFNFGCISPQHTNCPKMGPDVDFGSSPILQDLGGGRRVLLAGQKSGIMFGLDPDDGGKELWQVRVGAGSGLGGIEWGSATDGTNVYAANSDISTLAPVAPGATRPPAGGLAAIDIRSGKLVWKVMPPKPACAGQPGCSAGQLAAVTVVPGVVFSGSMDGHLRAYSTKDGSVLWDFDTLPSVATVNGVRAHGGSMSGSGPTVSGDMLYVLSGFTGTSGMVGNVLLAFEVVRH